MSESPKSEAVDSRPILERIEDEESKAGSSKTSVKDGEEGGDDLFGAGDDDDDDDEEDQIVVKPVRQKRQVDSASPNTSPLQLNREKQQFVPSSPSNAADSASVDSYAALEHRETSAEPPMGLRDTEGAPAADIQEASFTLPSLPFRRGLPHYFARLPNLLQLRSEVFDEMKFDEKSEDDLLQNKEGIRIDDEGLRSLLTTSNTIRWRWTDKYDEDGVRIPESNARIVKWSDGSSSLQLGSEIYDITQATERAQATDIHPSSSSASISNQPRLPLQPAQHLTHLFIKHDGQEQINIYQAEAPIMGNFTFRPTSTASESHQRLAKAVRKQKGTLVKETIVREDPEAEKERLEKEEKKRGQARLRELKKKNKGKEEEDDDAFWDSAARSARRTGARSLATGLNDSDAINGYEEEGIDDTVDDDGFVVDDDADEDLNGEGSQDEDMDVDDEPDEMELMEAEMEKQEALRKAGRLGKTGASNNTDNLATDAKKEDSTATTRKRRVVDSDDE